MTPRPVSLGAFTMVFTGFALLVTAANLYAETTNFLDHTRTAAAIWMVLVLLAPAFCLYLWQRGEADPALAPELDLCAFRGVD